MQRSLGERSRWDRSAKETISAYRSGQCGSHRYVFDRKLKNLQGIFSQIPFSSQVGCKISGVTSFMNVVNIGNPASALASKALSDCTKVCCVVAALFALQ